MSQSEGHRLAGNLELAARGYERNLQSHTSMKRAELLSTAYSAVVEAIDGETCELDLPAFLISSDMPEVAHCRECRHLNIADVGFGMARSKYCAGCGCRIVGDGDD